MTYQPAAPTTFQNAPYKVTKNGIYLNAGLAIAFSEKRTALVYDPKTYVAVESNGNFTAVLRKSFNNTDCDCERSQICVNGQCKDVVKQKARPAASRGKLHVNGQYWSRSRAATSAKVRVQGTSGIPPKGSGDLCKGECDPQTEVCLRDHDTGGGKCVPFEPGDKGDGIRGILQTVSW